MFVCIEKFKAKVNTDYTNSSPACPKCTCTVIVASPTAFHWKLTGKPISVFGFAPFVVCQVCLVRIISGYRIFILGFCMQGFQKRCDWNRKLRACASVFVQDTARGDVSWPEREAGLTSGGSKYSRLDCFSVWGCL